MLYYFWKEVKKLPKRTAITSPEKPRNFPREIKKLQKEIKPILKPSQSIPRKKSNPISIQSQSLRPASCWWGRGEVRLEEEVFYPRLVGGRGSAVGILES